MDVFNKLYSQVTNSVRDSVSTTVSQLSGVLPGNPVTREYESSGHIASAGSGLLWKIYKGMKRSTKQEAAIFVFEKRQLERWNKNDRDFILESLKRGVQQLTKIRHPRVLTVQHPLEESRDSLAFATEPVFASLANVLGQTTNMPQPANMSDYKFFDIEVKYGLLQIGEGLQFLHNDVKLLHKNICPESIVINSSGVWKIFGLDFCVANIAPPNEPAMYPFESYSPTIPAVCQPDLNYLAPECITSQKHSEASDMFSLGMLAYIIHSKDKQCISPIREMSQFKMRVQQLNNLNMGKLQSVPQEFREYVKLLLNVNPEVRLDAHQFVKVPYFDDVGIKTLTYLDSLLQWDNLQKSQFYKGLPDALQKLPHRVKLQRVLACLTRDLAQPTMVPFILPSIFDICQNCTKEEYVVNVLPHLRPLMKLVEPPQILLMMLQKMELLLKLTPAEDIQQHVLPMLYRGLDSDSPQIHEMCLAVLPTFAGLLDHANVKNSLLPRIKKLCLSTSTLSVRVNCLLCVGKLLEHLDKWLVIDEVLPFLPQIPSREPAVLMGILGIYKIAMSHKKLGISKEIIATRILPFLIPLCIENGLTLAQFGALVQLVKDMFNLVENEHKTKLEQLNSVRDEQKMLSSNMPSVSNTPKPLDLAESFTSLNVTSNDSVLEQKQTILKQQETMMLFESQPQITPQKLNNNLPQTKTKDLTSMLFDDFAPSNITSQTPTSSQTSSLDKMINSSLTNMNLTSPSGNNNLNRNSSDSPYSATKTQPFHSFQSTPNYNLNQNFGTPMPPANNNFSQNLAIMPRQGIVLQSNKSCFQTPQNQNLNWNQMQPSPDWSGFANNENKLQPIGNQSAPTSNANVNKLTNQDLLDFLN